MNWVTDFRIITGRNEYNKRRKFVKRWRQAVVAKCLAAGITDKSDIQAIIRESHPTFPSSIRTLQRDVWDLEERWETEDRCSRCGGCLVPMSANGGDGEAAIGLVTISDELVTSGSGN